MGLTKTITKDHRGRGGGHLKIREDHDHKGGDLEKLAKKEDPQKGNNYSQDQLSKGG